jgi:hypothetical protein
MGFFYQFPPGVQLLLWAGRKFGVAGRGRACVTRLDPTNLMTGTTRVLVSAAVLSVLLLAPGCRTTTPESQLPAPYMPGPPDKPPPTKDPRRSELRHLDSADAQWVAVAGHRRLDSRIGEHQPAISVKL